jgi:hypothetical protein
MAASEKNIFKKALELVPASYHQLASQSIASDLLNRLSVEISDISYKYGTAINLSDDYIYPLNVNRFDDIFDRHVEFATWQTIGLHWYGGAEKARECVHGMNPDTWRGYKNSIAAAIEMSGVA